MRRQFLVALRLAVLIALAVPITWAETNQVDEVRHRLLSQGHEAYATENYPAARAAYARLLTLPESAPVYRSLAQLRIAQSFVREGNLATAQAEYAKVVAMSDAPVHHRWEAEQQQSEIRRRQAGLPALDPTATHLRLPPLPSPGVVFHVAVEGSDANPGTAERPLASLIGARDAIRALKQRQGLPPGGVQVVVRRGQYDAAPPLKLAAEDSGTEMAPIVYRAASGEHPRFSSAVKLTGWRRVKDPSILERLPAEAREKVWQTPPLDGPGFTNLWPLRLGGFASGLGFTTHPVRELFFDGQAMPLARWPNDGFVRVAGVSTNDSQPMNGRSGGRPGRIVYEGDRPQRWKDEREILLYGYWFWDWADSYERVASLDTDKREISLAPPYHTYGYRKGQPFYALNLLSEIDQPGEWYLDRAARVIYFYPPSAPVKTLDEAAAISTAPWPLVEFDNVSHVRLQGLAWDMSCADGIIIRGGDHCVLEGCVLSRFGGNGVEIHGGTAHGLLSCNLYSMGRGGVVLSGGDRKTLTPGNHFVENCHLHDLSRVDHTYTPAVIVSGVGNRVTHNLMHDIRSSAIRVGGNDHRIEYNEVCRVVVESDDQGGVDMHGNATYRGNVFRYNYWHHIGNWRTPDREPACGQAGIRFDDAICGQLVYGNIFRRCAAGKLGFGGVQIHGGKENIIDNNLFVDCATAVSFSPWNEAHWRNFTKGQLASPEINAALYLARYPELARLDENLNVNQLWRNLVLNCGEFLRRNRGGAQLLGNCVATNNPGFAEVTLGDFRLLEKAPGLDRLGLQSLPFEEMGLYQDDWRQELPQALVQRMRAGQ